MRPVVMKFGGSSVVDATAIERVIGIVATGVQSRAGARGRGVGPRRGNRPAPGPGRVGPARGRRGEVDEGVAVLRRRHVDEASRLGADLDGALLLPAIDRHFDELRAALAAIGDPARADPVLLDLIAAAGELLSSRLVAAAMAARGLASAWVDARKVIVTNDSHMCALPLMEETAAAAVTAITPHLSAGVVPVLGGFVGRTARRHHDARPRRIRLLGVACRRRDSRRGDSDLDRRRRHADGGSPHRRRCGSRPAPVVRRGGGAGLLRRQGAASEHDLPGGLAQYSGPDPEQPPARGPRHAHHRRSAARPGASALRGPGLQARHHHSRHHFDPHAHGARLPPPGLRGFRSPRDGRRRRDHI